MVFNCTFCDKLFKKRFNLTRHIKTHGVEVATEPKSFDFEKYNFKCLEDDCSSSFKSRQDLIQHLESNHEINIQTEVVTFEKKEDFEIWKTKTESDEKCHFIKNKNREKAAGIKKIYFNCSRSISKKRTCNPNRKRALKMQGYSKLDYACVSSMVVTVDDSAIHVKRIVNHYGHNKDLEHLRLSKQDCDFVAGKLSLGVSKEKILQANTESIGPTLKRADLLTMQDVSNISKKYHIDMNDGVKHKDDVVSIEIFVQECLEDPDNNSILFYKRQGDFIAGFKNEDFCLITMNSYQEHMLKTFGGNIICVDSTHGLNGYDFELTTVLVVDNYREGFPVAFMFTNKKCTEIHEFLFTKIKSRVGQINCKTFMSDITTVFYSAWEITMGSADHQLYCSWHVDRAWRSNLIKVQNSQKRPWVYKTLKVLQQSVKYQNESDFITQLNETLKMLLDDPETENFGIYFSKNYSINYLKWAYYFRRECGINNNMYLESMHKVVKYFYLNGRKVRRLDKGLHAVQQYTKRKIAERVIKNTKGKRTAAIADINARHRKALASKFKIESEEINKWNVTSNDELYIVEKTQDNCCTKMCKACDICLHAFRCTCMDFYIRASICKHIHSVCLTTNKEVNVTDVASIHFNDISPKMDDTGLCLSFLTNNLKVREEKQRIEEALSNLQVTLKRDINFENVNVNHIVSLLNSANDLLRIGQVPANFQLTASGSGNQKIIKQKRFQPKSEKSRKFFSTKKKTVKKNSLKLPSSNDVKNIKSHLHGEKLVISTSNGHDYCVPVDPEGE